MLIILMVFEIGSKRPNAMEYQSIGFHYVPDGSWNSWTSWTSWTPPSGFVNECVSHWVRVVFDLFKLCSKEYLLWYGIWHWSKWFEPGSKHQRVRGSPFKNPDGGVHEVHEVHELRQERSTSIWNILGANRQVFTPLHSNVSNWVRAISTSIKYCIKVIFLWMCLIRLEPKLESCSKHKRSRGSLGSPSIWNVHEFHLERLRAP